MQARATSSLVTQLVAIILACLIVPTLTVGWVGYNEAYESIRNEKISNVGRIADGRRDQLVTILQRTNSRVQAFLSDVASRCVNGPVDTMTRCANEALLSFVNSERALGAILRVPGSDVDLSVGSPANTLDDGMPFQHNQLARFSRPSSDRQASYDIIGEEPRAKLHFLVTFPVVLIQGLFVNAPDLGASGETFLTDREGLFLTQSRYPSVQGHSHPISARPMQACLHQENREVLDQDYRDVAIIHGFRFVTEIGGGCIMAHIDQAEAFAPLEALRWRMLALGLVFIVLATLISIVIARRIAGPISKLTQATREIIAGNYRTQAEVSGNNQITELAISFNRMARTIAENDTRVRAIIDGTLDAFVGVDAQGVVVAFNPGAVTLFALPAIAILGDPVAKSLLPEPLLRWFVAALGKIQAGEPVARASFDLEDVRADGRALIADVNFFVVGTGAEAMIIACLRDVASRRQAERKAQRLARILKTTSEGNQVLLRATDETALFSSMCRVIVEYGGYRMAWIGLVKYNEDKTVDPVAYAGHEEGYLERAKITWADRPRGCGPTGMAIRTGVPQINDDILTDGAMGPWRQAALERGYLSNIALPLRDETGVFGALTIYAGEPMAFGIEEVKLLVELADDVSYGIVALRLRRAHDEMEHALRQSQKMEALGHLTGGIAHDFNNLLQLILTNLDLALHRGGVNDGIADCLRHAISGAEQGAKLTSQLLAFARRQPLKPEPRRLDRLVGDMIGMLRRTLGEPIAIEMVVSQGLWTALVDPNQLQNALLNLAINARDAMPEGGKLTIELTNCALDAYYAATHRDVAPGEYVMLAVTDTGTGMRPEFLEQACEPFFTTKAEGLGTGLGLAMVYGFVKQSGGHIKIYSEIGLGTSVKLYLPRTLQGEATHTPDEATVVERGHGETILIAEDDDAVRSSVVTQLAELGYRVLAASNGENALGILANGEPVDLLFTDVVMPGGLNGRKLADQARKISPTLPILFTSGYTENAIIHHGRLDEGVTLLSKPYRVVHLAQAVRKALRQAPKPAAPCASDGPAALTCDQTLLDRAAPLASILVVEDDEMIRVGLASLLETYGYHVTATASPSEALCVLERTPPPDLLVSDYTLPEMTGIVLIKQALARHPTLAVILATGHSVDPSELPDPSIVLLLKPFLPRALRTAIQSALAVRRNPLERELVF